MAGRSNGRGWPLRRMAIRFDACLVPVLAYFRDGGLAGFRTGSSSKMDCESVSLLDRIVVGNRWDGGCRAG
jgi:hypothetical protein